MIPASPDSHTPTLPLPHTLSRVGTAYWSIPASVRERFPPGASVLERYAGLLDAVEIDSTFKATPRPATFARWAATVPEHFRFALKLPRQVTHVLRLRDAEEPLAHFVRATDALGPRRGPLLVQLPPSLELDLPLVERFLRALRRLTPGPDALEPRHPTWFTPEATSLLAHFDVARVAADPPRHPSDGLPAGSAHLAYFRLHGAPRIYFSDYADDALRGWAATIAQARERVRECWCIFDNTAAGMATGNALTMKALLHR